MGEKGFQLILYNGIILWLDGREPTVGRSRIPPPFLRKDRRIIQNEISSKIYE